MRQRWKHWALLGIFAGLSGCGTGNGTTTPIFDAPVTRTRSYRNLQISYSVPRVVYNRGEDVPATFTVTNNGTTPMNVGYFGCGPETHVSRANTKIYDYPDVCGTIIRLPLQPGASATEEAPWIDTEDERDNPPTVVPPGNYVLTPNVRIWLDGDREYTDVPMDSITIRVQ